MQVANHGIQVQALEGLGVVERLAHRVGAGRVLVTQLQNQLLGPPAGIAMGRGQGLRMLAGGMWALGLPRNREVSMGRIDDEPQDGLQVWRSLRPTQSCLWQP
jgi:hypothetical protein